MFEYKKEVDFPLAIKCFIWLGLFGLALSIAGEFFIRSGFSTKIYLTVHLAGLAFIIWGLKNTAAIQYFIRATAFWFLGLFLFWCAITGIWGGYGLSKAAATTAGIALYVFVVSFIVRHQPDLFRGALLASLLIGACFFTWGAIEFYLSNNLSTRLSQYGIKPMNPLVVGMVAGGFSILTLAMAIGSQALSMRALYLCLALLFLSITIMTQSRTPLAGIGVSLIIFAFIFRKNYRLVGAGIIIFLLFAAGAAIIGGAWQRLLDVNSLMDASNRLPIWLNTVEAAQDNLLLGIGLGSEAVFYGANHTPYEHPHSLYLQALYFTGVIGLVLYLAMYGYAVKQAIIGNEPRGDLELCAAGLLSYIIVIQGVEMHAFVTGPGEYWFMLWMPFGILIGCSSTTPKASTAAKRASHSDLPTDCASGT